MFFLLSALKAPTRRSIANAGLASQFEASVQALLLEYQRVLFELGDHPITRDEITPQNLLCQRILDLRLDGPLQRPRTVHRVETRFADLVACLIVQTQRDVALRQS